MFLLRARDKILSVLFPRHGEGSQRCVHVAQAVCLLFFLGSVAYLIFAEHPWEMGIRERLQSGKNLTIDQDIALGFTGAALLTVVVSLVFHQTARWWAQPVAAELAGRQRMAGGSSGGVSRRAFWWLVVMAMVLAAALRLPLASKSLWWDEIWTLQRVALGQWVRDGQDPSQMEWRQRDWKRAFFYYQKPTNHIPFTVAAKACTHLWQKMTGAPHDAFDELVFRLPSMLSALASVVVIALLGRELGFTRAGIAAAFLLALHPWHIQYGIDGRAFSMVVLFSLLSVLQLLAALRTARWRNWIGFALCQLLLLWAFPYALFFSGLVVLAGFVAVACTGTDARSRWLMAGRFFAANSLSAIGLAFLIGPLVPQLLKWTDEIHGNTMIHAAFLRQLAANLVSGMGWDGGPGLAYFGIPTLDRLPGPLIWLIFLLAGLLVFGGLLRVCRSNGARASVLVATALSAPVAIIIAYFDTHYFYTRYVIYVLPFLVLFCAVAVDGLGAKMARARPWLGSTLLTGALVLACVSLWSPRMALLLERPVSPTRDVARMLESFDSATPGGILAAGFNLGGNEPTAYYRHIHYLDNFEDLTRLVEEARGSGRPLYIFYGYESFNRADEPEPFRLLDDPEVFVKLADFHGIEPDFHYQLFRFRGLPVRQEGRL